MQTQQLAGLRCLITRSQDQAEAIKRQIEGAAGHCLVLPCLEIQKLSLNAAAIPILSEFDQAIFTSPNAVRYFKQSLQEHGLSWPKHIATSALGPGTAKQLRAEGIPVLQYPSTADSEHLLALPSFRQVQGQKILLIKGLGGREHIEKTLRAIAAELCCLEVYQRIPAKANPELVRQLWQEDAVDIILVFSQDTMQYLLAQFSSTEARHWLLQKSWLVPSLRLAKIAEQYGLRHSLVSPIDQLLDHLYRFRTASTDKGVF